MTGTGSPGGTEQAAGLGDLDFADVMAMAATIGPPTRLSARFSTSTAGISSTGLRSAWGEKQLRPLGLGEAVGGGEIRLDVEERRAVDAIDPAHAQRGAVDAEKL